VEKLQWGRRKSKKSFQGVEKLDDTG